MRTPLLLLALLLQNCGGGGGASSPLPVAATSAPQVYVALGDSITHGWDGSQYLTTQAYVNIVAASLGMTLVNLAIDGEQSGPPITSGGADSGVLLDEVPQVPANASLVTVYTGIVDENQTAIGNDNYATTAGYYAANVRAIVAGIRQRAPQARIVLIAPPDLMDRSPWYGVPNRSALATMVTAMKGALVATGLPVVDLECEPAMYDPANFLDGTNLHPLASGQAMIAADVLAQIAHPSAPGHCSYEAAL